GGKAHAKPWQMTTRDVLGEVSDHSLSMAATARSTSATAVPPPTISNATSTIAKRRTRISPDETPRRIYKAADSSPRCTRPQVLVRVILWEGVTYLPARRRACAANA